MRLVVSAEIELDLQEIGAFIAKHNSTRAVTFIQELRSRFIEILQDPLLYRLRPQFGEGIRVNILGQYVILYRVVDDEVRIVRVVHGARDLTTLRMV